MLKVLHIISGGDSGGAKTHMFALLDKQKYKADVTVMCLMKGIFYEELLLRDVKNVLFEQSSRFDLSTNSRIAKYINDEKFDIVNCHGARANFVARAIKNKIAAPIVTTVHSDPLLDFDTFYKKLVFQNLNIISLKKIDHKIAVSDTFKDMLISRGTEPNSIETVYNGMDYEEEVSFCSRADFAEKYNIPIEEGTVYFGIAARFNRVKGVDIFLRAAAELYARRKNVYFVIAGDGEDREQLTALCSELGIEDRVRFCGFVSPIYDFLNFIDVNLLTSLSESFPYSMLEGAKMSVPMVASKVGGIPRLVREGETGFLFNASNYPECADKMEKFVENPELISSMGNAIHNRAKENFSNENLASSYISIYEKILRKEKKKGRYDIVLAGYYGFGNFGDELMLKKLVTALKKEKDDLSMLVLSGNKDYTARSAGVNSISRLNIPGIKKALSTAPLFVNGGGNLLQNVTSKRSLRYYLAINSMAKKSGAKTVVLANGIGPIVGEGDIKKTLGMLRRTDLITVRDEETLEFLSENGIESAHHCADLAFLPESEDASLVPKEFFGRKYMVVSLRSFAGHEKALVRAVSEACDKMAEKYGLEIVFVPFQSEKDTAICRETMERMEHESRLFSPSDKFSRIESICGIISGAEIVLGMRLHALIYAFSRGIPCTGIEYDPKIGQFAAENGIAGIPADDLDSKTLFDNLERLIGSGGTDREIIAERSGSAKKNIDLLLDLYNKTTERDNINEKI